MPYNDEKFSWQELAALILICGLLAVALLFTLAVVAWFLMDWLV